MLVYRITLRKYSTSLFFSGNPARWNSKDVRMIYTASTRALACLENVVHRNAVGLQQNFRVMVIEIPGKISVNIIEKKSLPSKWHLFESYPATQAIGDEWILKGESPVLQVPSAIIAEEFNYLINPFHKDFDKIKLISVEPFDFDPRIKE